MRIAGNKKLITGIVVSGVIAFKLATAPIDDTFFSGTDPLSAFSNHDYRDIVPINLNTKISDMTRRTDFLTQILATDRSSLLWTGTIDLSPQDEFTVANVIQASNAINLVVLNPGDTFSFNDTVGLRTEEKGYKPGLMYSNGDVITGIGGGICIVSTLLYKSALETGLKIIERHPHSGPVSYAEPGRDAAVSFGWADLKIKNNSGKTLYIKTSIEDNKLVVSIFGTKKPGQTVEISAIDFEELPYKIYEKEDPTVPDGKVVVDQEAKPGYVVTIVRTIRQDGKLVSREVISHDVMLPKDKLMRVPPYPFVLPSGILPLPGLPDMPAPSQIPAEPEHQITQPVPNQVPAQAPAPAVPSVVPPPVKPVPVPVKTPVSGTITIPEEAKPAEPKVDQPKSELPSSGPASVPAEESGRSLDTSERATPAASE